MTGRMLLLSGLVTTLVLQAATAEEKVLYRKASPFNTIVVTEDEDGLRTLFFGNRVKQSVVKPGDADHLELAYARVMPAALAVVEDPRRVLIVGLGGGTIPSFLHKHYPQATIDVVDIDPEVVRVAKRYFGFREDRTMRAHAMDGRRFIQECRDPYDLIFLDAFGSENIPYDLATREFLQEVRKALTPEGIAVGNVWSRTSNPLYDSMVRTYQDVFEQLYILDVSGASNKILLALPQRQPLRGEQLQQRARKISKQRRFPFDMEQVIRYGFRGPEPQNTRGQLLLDKDKARRAG